MFPQVGYRDVYFLGSEARKDSKLRCGLVPAGGQKMVPRGERAALAGLALAVGRGGSMGRAPSPLFSAWRAELPGREQSGGIPRQDAVSAKMRGFSRP